MSKRKSSSLKKHTMKAARKLAAQLGFDLPNLHEGRQRMLAMASMRVADLAEGKRRSQARADGET